MRDGVFAIPHAYFPGADIPDIPFRSDSRIGTGAGIAPIGVRVLLRTGMSALRIRGHLYGYAHSTIECLRA
jgi:hypothetical protein